MYKRFNDFHKKFITLKVVNPQTEANKDLKEKVLDKDGDIFNELYYICKEKYEEEKDALNKAKHINTDIILLFNFTITFF